MTQNAIEVVELSKKYHIGKLKDMNLTLQERIGRAVSAPFQRIAGLVRGNATAAADLSEEFWALKDVSFTMEKGEVVAVVGRNGAGKSTLLKLLSRITEPTSGHATIRGRVGSLLEVGTGFHPELSGRENVYLNGSILGMSRREVDAKFDEIVEFSEIGKFIDTPAKHYSSGMRVRLAFSVAAHLEPEVMFVDEVLSVGDVAFRKKCSEKVQSIADSGCTVIVVSHNAQAVTAMCDRAIWLANGQLVADGEVNKIVSDYLSQSIGLSGEREYSDEETQHCEVAKVRAVRVRDKRGNVVNSIDVREEFCVETELEVLKPDHSLVLKYDLNTSDNMGAFASLDTKNPTWQQGKWDVGTHVLRMWVPGNFLQFDTYPISVTLWEWQPERRVEWAGRDVVCVHVTDHLEGPTAACGLDFGVWPGPVRPIMQWDMESGSRNVPLDGAANGYIARP